MYLLSIISNIYAILNKKQKFQFILLQLFFLFSALIQIAGITSIAPFIALLSKPEIIHSNALAEKIYLAFHFNSDTNFIIGFAVFSIATIIVSNCISALTLWLLLRFSVALGGKLQSDLFNKYLYRDYIFHKTTNHTKIIAMISQEAPRFVYMVLQPFLLLTSHSFIAALILIGLFVMNPVIAFASGFIIGGSYLITYLLVKKSLNRHGAVITERNKKLQSILAESFIGIKDIKLNSLEEKYTESFNNVNQQGLNSNAYISLAGDLPRFVIEAISFGAILLLAIILLLNQSNDGNVISLLSIYAIAGYKLLPTMQQIYKSISSMSANGSVVSTLRHVLEIKNSPKEPVQLKSIGKVDLLELRDIHYTYPSNNNKVLDNISLHFALGKLNTIAGPSGSGKSTLADIMLGLLPPISGSIYINQQPLTATAISHYQQSIGYVPQNIFILDDSVVANIAFGVGKENVDIAKVERVLKEANAWEFVERLPHGINTQLGQDGKLLSGGQRQRIGIARALYRETNILILDEPTSALDIDSEYELMMLLATLKTSVLIIVISHRPAAIKLSDNIILLEQGKITAAGSVEHLQTTSEHFRDMMEKGMVTTS